MELTAKEIRTSTGLTQKEFAEKYGIPLPTIKAWETGRTTPEYLLRFLAYYVEHKG